MPNGNEKGNNEEGNNKERIEYLLKLSELQRQTMLARWSLQWKILFGYWFGIGAFTWFAIQSQAFAGYFNTNKELSIFILAYVFALISFIYLELHLIVGDATNKRWWFYYEDQAEFRMKLIKEDDVRPRPTPGDAVRLTLRTTNNVMKLPICRVPLVHRAQILFTIVFLAVSFLIVYYSTLSQKKVEINPACQCKISCQ